jgi:hypothetical protein
MRNHRVPRHATFLTFLTSTRPLGTQARTLQLLWDEHGATHPDGFRTVSSDTTPAMKRQRDVVMNPLALNATAVAMKKVRAYHAVIVAGMPSWDHGSATRWQ